MFNSSILIKVINWDLKRSLDRLKDKRCITIASQRCPTYVGRTLVCFKIRIVNEFENWKDPVPILLQILRTSLERQ